MVLSHLFIRCDPHQSARVVRPRIAHPSAPPSAGPPVHPSTCRAPLQTLNPSAAAVPPWLPPIRAAPRPQLSRSSPPSPAPPLPSSPTPHLRLPSQRRLPPPPRRPVPWNLRAGARRSRRSKSGEKAERTVRSKIGARPCRGGPRRPSASEVEEQAEPNLARRRRAIPDWLQVWALIERRDSR